jgi:CheY-like chemotaxis protein
MPVDPEPAILVLDDDAAVREIAADAFRLHGIEVFEASSGTEALRVLSGHPEIALVFADVRMPGMSGTDLAREVMRLRPHVLVVLTSGHTGDTHIPAELPFLKKPWTLSELDALV